MRDNSFCSDVENLKITQKIVVMGLAVRQAQCTLVNFSLCRETPEFVQSKQFPKMVLTLLLHCKLRALVVHWIITHAMHHGLLLQTMSY